MALFDSLIRKVQYTGDAISEIGYSANAKGAGINLDTDPLDEWGVKILNNIPEVNIIQITVDSAGRINGTDISGETATVPTTSKDGSPVSPVFNPTNIFALWPLIISAKKFVVPRYFTTISWNSGSSSDYAYDYNPVTEVEFNAEAMPNGGPDTFQNLLRVFTNLRKLVVNETEYVQLRLTYGGSSGTADDPIEIKLTDATNLNACNVSSNLNSKYFVVTADKVTTLTGQSGNNSQFRYGAGGTLSLRSLEVMPHESFGYGTKLVTYLPALTTIEGDNNFGAGSTTLYIGPNLSTMSSTAAGKMANNATVHIPPGESTTKATLDSLGVPYIQDYII